MTLAAARPVLIESLPGNTMALELIDPASLPYATTEPVAVIAPIQAPDNSSC